MLNGAACGLLRLYRGLAVSLAMDAFPRLILLALRAVPLLVSLLAAYETLVVVVPTFPLCFHTSSFGILAWVVLVSSTSPRLGPRSSHRPSVTPFCCLPTLSTIGLNYSLVPLLLGDNDENASGSCITRSKRIIFSTLRRRSNWLISRRCCLNQRLAVV